MLQYRTTPRNNNMPSPSEMLMSRQLHTKLPISSDGLKPKILDSRKIREIFEQQRSNSSRYYNRNAVSLKPVEIGEKIYFKRNPTSEWFSGIIVEKCREPRSFLIRDEDGVVYRRSRQHM